MPYADNGGVRIHYQVEGEGPALVLQHGFTESTVDWYESGYVKALRTDYRLILVDARGHGASDKPHDPDAYVLDRRVGTLSQCWTRWKSQRLFFGATRWAGGPALALPNMPMKEFALW
jgi:pimeloyl-ACP methyl ester carboxylesterase